VKISAVQRLYNRFGARWYDPYSFLWLGLARSADRAFTHTLREISTARTRILDLGCGTGANFSRLVAHHMRFKTYTGVDFSIKMLEIARKRFPQGTFVHGDARAIHGTYDLIISTWMFEHLSTKERLRILSYPGKHLHMFLAKRPFTFWFQPFARIFHFAYVDDTQLPGTKKRFGRITILSYEK